MLCIASLFLATSCAAPPQDAPLGGIETLPANPLSVEAVSGLERTDATVAIFDDPDQGRALRVVIGKDAAETNAAQLTVMTTEPVAAKDVLLATVWLRGAMGSGPARAEFLFEGSHDPWTKSVSYGLEAAGPKQWRRFMIPFAAAIDYGVGQAMASVRLAFGPQTVEIAGLSVRNYKRSTTLEKLQEFAISQSPLGETEIVFDRSKPRQTLVGMGGNFCQPRYGRTEPMDAVGAYNLEHLDVANARIGLPLEKWTPEPGVYVNDAQAKASLQALAMMQKRGIPTVVSIWEGPIWMLGEPPESSRELPRDKYEICADAITAYLKTAKDEYGVDVAYFSFNEPDYGVNFRFSSAQMAEFIRVAGPKFAASGLKTKFLVADTANGSNFRAYATPLLEDSSIAPYLGPIAFHCWDALSAPEPAYRAIAELGRKFKKPVWCMEAGHDAQLWRADDPWGPWDNAIKTAMAYARTVDLTEAALMDYWTYQDNYPLVDSKTVEPWPVFHVIRQMEEVLAPGWRVATVESKASGLYAIGSFDPKSTATALLFVNHIGPGKARVSGLPKNAKFRLLTSTSSEQLRKSSIETNSSGAASIDLPARSVVTLVKEAAN